MDKVKVTKAATKFEKIHLEQTFKYTWAPQTVHNTPVMNILTRAPRGTDRSPEYNEHFC